MHAQSRPTLCHRVDCSPPGSAVQGILQGGDCRGCPFLLQGVFPQPLTCGLSALADSLPGVRSLPVFRPVSGQRTSSFPVTVLLGALTAPLGLILFSRLLPDDLGSAVTPRTSSELVRGSCRPRSCEAHLSVGAPGKEPEATGRLRFLHRGPAPQEAGAWGVWSGGREGAHMCAAGTAQSSELTA